MSVDKAALDLGARPACLDRAGRALATVDHGDQGCGDTLEEMLVVAGGFACAPVPGNVVIQGVSHDQAPASGVGAVEEDLVVDPALVSDLVIGDISEPAPRKPPFHGGVADPRVSCDLPQSGGRCVVLDELSKHRCVGDIAAGFGGWCTADFASPRIGALGCAYVALKCPGFSSDRF